MAEIAAMERQRDREIDLKERFKRIEVEAAERALDREAKFQRSVECVKREQAATLHNREILQHWKEINRWMLGCYSLPDEAYDELRRHMQYLENYLMASKTANPETQDLVSELNPLYGPPAQEFWKDFPQRHKRVNK